MKNNTIKIVICLMAASLFVACGKEDSGEVHIEQATDSQVSENTQPESNVQPETTADAQAESKSDAQTEPKADVSSDGQAQGEQKSSDNTVLQDSANAKSASGKEIAIDSATQKKLNVFLSNFSEAYFFQYDKDAIDYAELCEWALSWSWWNDKGRWDENGRYFYSLEEMNTVLDKYIGLTVTDAQVKATLQSSNKHIGYTYENGNFHAPYGDGEFVTSVSIVSKVEDLGDNRFKLYFDDYYVDRENERDIFKASYAMNAKEAAKHPKLENYGSGFAIARKEGSLYKLEHLETNLKTDME